MWINQCEDISGYFGFVYQITNKLTGASYIGKKQYFRCLKKTVRGKKNRITVKVESDWRTYTSSSKHLNEDIEKFGLESFEFKILSNHTGKQELAFAEIREQWERDVVYAKFPDGSKMYYNRRIERINYSKEIAGLIKFV